MIDLLRQTLRETALSQPGKHPMKNDTLVINGVELCHWPTLCAENGCLLLSLTISGLWLSLSHPEHLRRRGSIEQLNEAIQKLRNIRTSHTISLDTTVSEEWTQQIGRQSTQAGFTM